MRRSSSQFLGNYGLTVLYAPPFGVDFFDDRASSYHPSSQEIKKMSQKNNHKQIGDFSDFGIFIEKPYDFPPTFCFNPRHPMFSNRRLSTRRIFQLGPQRTGGVGLVDGMPFSQRWSSNSDVFRNWPENIGKIKAQVICDFG